MRTAWLLLLCLAVPSATADSESDFDPPVRLEAEGKPIAALGGHAAPSVADADGDGVRDLLVGQFLGEGASPFEAPMRFHRNVGTNKAPRFAGFRCLEGGGALARVPTG
jgi:hypothetical protein